MQHREEMPHCDFMHAHAGLVARVQAALPDEEVLCDLAELFKVFGDSTRIKLLSVLLEGEICVCDMAQMLGLSQSAVSHQLRVLKGAELVKYRRDGKTVFYSLADDHVKTIISNGMEHVLE
ncbi:MAG: ArsR family transcriptional regulator [Clostridia bacterium]|nr:metalloregulator ArsR/SmtB family transcription factor [Candidatus Pelethousia sp.]NCB31670.1 ArsR family transcriptional regulator [Clostridia bacterium]